jgi:hypothetical protein
MQKMRMAGREFLAKSRVSGMITSWSFKKQASVSLISIEAEYIATFKCVHEVMFTQSLIKELTEEWRPAVIYVDILGALFLSKKE